MSGCERFQDWMAEALYDELDPARRAEFEAHVGGCENCGELYRQLRSTLDAMSARRRPDPGDAFWSGYWQRLEERVARDETVADASRFDRRRSFGSWGYRAAAAVLVLAAGVWMGRTLLAPAPQPVIENPGVETAGHASPADAPVELAVRDSIRTAPAIDAPAAPAGDDRPDRETVVQPEPGVTLVAADTDPYRFIDRSQVVLLSLLNYGAGEDAVAADYDAQRRHAGTLVAEGRRVQENLTSPEDRRLRELVGQLQLILREIANLEAGSDLDAVEMIRDRVDREGVLLQIDLTQMREASASSKKQSSGTAID